MLILHNHLVTKLTRSLDALDAAPEIVSLDPTPNGVSAAPSLAELLSDPASARAFESIAVQDWLMQAVDHLPKSQAQFIRDFYFSDMDYATIARRLGKTVTEVYLLKFRALTNLKKILQKEKISPAKALKRVEGHD